MNIENELSSTLFHQREHDDLHSLYETELTFYTAVQSGDWDKVSKVMSPLTSKGLGQLSKNSVRNLQYHLVISIALITRFCIEGGLDQEAAYSLSDLFIQKTDQCIREQEITELHKAMVFEYTKRMGKLSSKTVTSKPLVLCLEYIYKHLHDPLNLQEISEYVGLNATYLSTLFKKEMGISMVQYIQQRKVEAAMNMLKYSNYPYADISNYFAFSSHSHFISVFKKYTGMTPKKFRDEFYSTNWKDKTK